MRSNERAGIVSVIMLFLWGTLLTEPFHIFVDYISGAARLSVKGLGGNDILCALASYVVLILVILLLQKLIITKAGTYIPCILAIVTAGAFCYKSLYDGHIDLKRGIILAVLVAVVMLFYIIKNDSLLLWAASVYTYSISTALITALLFVPLSKLNSTVGKILYITRYNTIKITEPFNGVAGLPELVWGIFLVLVASFPIVFLATQKGKS
ncbi:MAG: hypothetical protein IJ819_11340 [Clostridiales bacterium]|nr:hypothetical protein [Clostridiales bacterium]